MKFKKSLTVIGAAIAITSVSKPALADNFYGIEIDCTDNLTAAASLIDLATHLRCIEDDGEWSNVNTLWEKQRSPSCEVHASLAAKLYEAPVAGSKNPNKQEPTGAAVKLQVEKYEDAYQKLDQLQFAIDKSKLNSQFDPNPATAHKLVMDLKNLVEDAKICVNSLITK